MIFCSSSILIASACSRVAAEPLTPDFVLMAFMNFSTADARAGHPVTFPVSSLYEYSPAYFSPSLENRINPLCCSVLWCFFLGNYSHIIPIVCEGGMYALCGTFSEILGETLLH